MSNYYVYIITNKTEGTLYVGLTDDIKQRMKEHKSKRLTRSKQLYYMDILVYFEKFDNLELATTREIELKKNRRLWKFDLIKKDNIDWLDLANDW